MKNEPNLRSNTTVLDAKGRLFILFAGQFAAYTRLYASSVIKRIDPLTKALYSGFVLSSARCAIAAGRKKMSEKATTVIVIDVPKKHEGLSFISAPDAEQSIALVAIGLVHSSVEVSAS